MNSNGKMKHGLNMDDSHHTPFSNDTRYKWVIVVIFFFYNGIGWGVTQASNGVYFNPIADSLNLSRTAMSTTFAILLATGFSGSVVWGKLTDAWSIRWVLGMSGSLLSAGFLLASFSESLTQFILCFCIIGGLGLAGTFSPLTGTTMRWFPPRQRGFALGLSIAGVGVGTAIMPALADYLIYSEGWQYTFRTFAIIMLILTILATLLAKEPPTHKNKGSKENTPYPDTAPRPSLSSILKHRRFWLIFGMNVAAVTILQMCLVHLVPRAIDSGIDPSTAARLMGILGLASIAGKTGGGYLSDKFSPRIVYISSVSLIIIVLLGVNLGDMLLLYIGFATGFGIGYGACIMQSNLLSVKFFGTEHMSTVTGALSQGNMMGGVVGPIMAGILFDTTGSYNLPFIIASMVGIIGMVLCVMASAPYKSMQESNSARNI